MKRLLSFLTATVLTFAMACSFTVSADGTDVSGTELVIPKGTITIDGKKGAEWDGAPSITIDASNTVLTLIDETDEANVDPTDSVTVSFKYDDTYLYILEERKSSYLYTAFSRTLKHMAYRGDATDYFFSMYLPGAELADQQYSTCDILVTCDSADRNTTTGETAPLFQLRSTSLFSKAWGIPDNTNKWDIKSTMDSSYHSAVTEVKVAWDSLFQGNSRNGSQAANYKKYIPDFVKNGGFAIKFAAVIHEGNANRDHSYSRTYGANVLQKEGDIQSGTDLIGDDINNWVTLYVGNKNDSSTGQIDLEAIYQEAAQRAENPSIDWGKVALWVAIPLVVIVIAVIIVFRIFGIKLNVSGSDEEDDEEEEEDEEDEEYDEDEEDDEEE